MQANTVHEPSVLELVKELRGELAALIGQEKALAKAEVRERIYKAKAGAMYGAIAASAMYFGLFFILIAGACGLFEGLRAGGMPLSWAIWLAPLGVAAVCASTGLALMARLKKVIKE